MWVDRTGRATPVPGRPRPFQEFNLSPDGTRIAARVQDQDPDIWIYDLARQTETRLTFDPGTEVFPTWTPDGRHVAFGGPGVSLSWRAADGTGQVDVLAERGEASFRVPQAFMPDGKMLVFEERPRGSPNDIRIGWVMLDGGRTAMLPNDTMFPQRNAVLSPDGRWLAYESYESGTAEVYVRPFPDVNAGRWQISGGGGKWPLWNTTRGRTELFYLGAKGLMVTAVTTTPVFTPDATTFLFQTDSYTAGAAGEVRTNRRYAVAPDGQRFLFLQIAAGTSADAPSQQLMFVEHWFEELKRRAPTN